MGTGNVLNGRSKPPRWKAPSRSDLPVLHSYSHLAPSATAGIVKSALLQEFSKWAGLESHQRDLGIKSPSNTSNVRKRAKISLNQAIKLNHARIGLSSNGHRCR